MRGRQPLGGGGDGAARQAGKATIGLGGPMRGLGRVAAEELVATVAGEDDRHLLPREARQEDGGQAARIGKGLVEDARDLGEERGRVLAPNDRLVVLGAEPPRRRRRVAALVVRRLVEADGEGLDRRGGRLGGERRHQARVDTAREEAAPRDVAQDAGRDRAAEPPDHLFRRLGRRRGRPGRPRGRPVPVDRLRPVGLDRHVVRRWQLPDGAEDRVGGRHVLVGQVVDERPRIELAGHVGVNEERLQLRGEEKRVRESCVVERLLPEAIASQDEAPPRPVPEREGEHAFEPVEAGRAVVLVGVENDLGVGAAREPVAGRQEGTAQGVGVVDLTVRDQPDAAILVGQRLLPGRQVDDAKALRGQADRSLDPESLLVRPAVRDGLGHAIEEPTRDGPRPPDLEYRDDAAHVEVRQSSGGYARAPLYYTRRASANALRASRGSSFAHRRISMRERRTISTSFQTCCRSPP